MLQDHMARRNCLREQYYTGTRRYICVREDCRQYEAETICKFVMVFHKWLEEIASESNTIQAQEDIIQPGKIAGTDPVKLYVRL